VLTLPRLVARNLRFHWRGNVAVLLGVAVGSAVLTGALLVGDSLRGSLRDRAERQLKLYRKTGFVDFEILTNFYTENYPHPIFENGGQLKDMIVLRKEL